jgi:hypothetical protein
MLSLKNILCIFVIKNFKKENYVDILTSDLIDELEWRKLPQKKLIQMAVIRKEWNLYDSLENFRLKGLKQLALCGEWDRFDRQYEMEVLPLKKDNDLSFNDIYEELVIFLMKRGFTFHKIILDFDYGSLNDGRFQSVIDFVLYSIKSNNQEYQKILFEKVDFDKIFDDYGLVSSWIVEMYKQENKNSPFYLYFERLQSDWVIFDPDTIKEQIRLLDLDSDAKEQIQSDFDLDFDFIKKEVILSKMVALLCKGNFDEGAKLLDSLVGTDFYDHVCPFKYLICSENFKQILTILKNHLPKCYKRIFSHDFTWYIKKIPCENLKILRDIQHPKLDDFYFLCRMESDKKIESEFIDLLQVPHYAYNAIKQLILTNKIHLIKKYYDDINAYKLFMEEFIGRLVGLCEIELIERLIIDGRIQRVNVQNSYLRLARFYGHNSLIKLLSPLIE